MATPEAAPCVPAATHEERQKKLRGGAAHKAELAREMARLIAEGDARRQARQEAAEREREERRRAREEALARGEELPPPPPRPARPGGLCGQLMAAEASKTEHDEKRRAAAREAYHRSRARKLAIAQGLPVPPVLKPHEVKKARREAAAAEAKARSLAWVEMIKASRRG
jgi:hypothetical protein